MTEIYQLFLPESIRNMTRTGYLIQGEVSADTLPETCRELRENHSVTLKLLTASDERDSQEGFCLWYLFAHTEAKVFLLLRMPLNGKESFPSLTPLFHTAWRFERKVATLFGLSAEGHSDKRSLILHENFPEDFFPLRKDVPWNAHPDVIRENPPSYPFEKVEGEGIYEIPVGPVHAGIIEPGHFRFSVAGEEIILLEDRLGYTHKGSEKLFEKHSLPDCLRLSGKISGDSSFSHSLAFCLAVEKLADITVPKRASFLRVLFAELERLANHFGDIGAIMQDTGYAFGAGQGSSFREQVMQICKSITGNRFLRGVNQYGGVACDITKEERINLNKELQRINNDFNNVMTIAEGSDTLYNRLQGTGRLSLQTAEKHGITGFAARAAGINCDTRHDYPYAAYADIPLLPEKVVRSEGDVYDRFEVRVQEVRGSLRIIRSVLENLPEGAVQHELTEKAPPRLKEKSVALSAVEGWRGEIIYLLLTNEKGALSRVVPCDPSFLNWSVLGQAGAGNVVPDFPLINKSFNLSYSGNDL